MGEIKIKLEQGAIDALERRASQHGWDIAAEISNIVESELGGSALPADPIDWSRRIRAMSPRAVQQTDSLELIREGRNR
jgi:hypothetical protein